MLTSRIALFTSIILICAFAHAADPAANTPATTQSLPTLFIIGDSTVHNTGPGLKGWGDCIGELFDTTKINVINRAIGGRSSRMFLTEGRWGQVMQTLKPGDFVLMQFGHNDGGAINDTTRARGSIRGIGDETQEIDNQLTGKHEVIHSFGWYMRKYVTDTKGKGATPIVCSQVPRNDWADGKVKRSTESYAGWAKQIADDEHVSFIDLNDLIAKRYEALGPEKTKTFFPGDHTHTSPAGAELSASSVVEGIKQLKDFALASYLKPPQPSTSRSTTP